MSELRGKSFVLQKLQQRGIAWIDFDPDTQTCHLLRS
jgi:hypothetical protein